MTPRPPAPSIFSTFFAAGFTWNLGLGMSHILIPLYADHLGYSGVAIGSLVAVPVVLQITLNLVGGAWTDRVGGQRLLIVSSSALLIGGIVFAFASNLLLLFVGQILFIVSRAVFWPAMWAIASLLPGERSAQMGRLNSTTNAGQIVGTGLAGLLIVHFGFKTGFWALALLGGALSLVLMGRFAAPMRARRGAQQSMFAAYAKLARRPSIWFALMCAYVSALPFSLSLSFYPILLVSQGYTSHETGWIVALRAVGSVCAGVTAARFVRSASGRLLPVATALVVALSVLAVAAFHHPAALAVLFLLVGLGSGVMTLYFQMLVTDLSPVETRGSALALGGLGWGLSHLSTPLIMGALKDAFGIAVAFYTMGAIALVWAIGLLPLHTWAFRAGQPR